MKNNKLFLLVGGTFLIILSVWGIFYLFGPNIMKIESPYLGYLFIFSGLSTLGLLSIGMSLSPDEKIRTFDEVKNSFIVLVICGERNEFAMLSIEKYGECFVKMATDMSTPINLPNFRVGQHYFMWNGQWVPGYDTTKDAE